MKTNNAKMTIYRNKFNQSNNFFLFLQSQIFIFKKIHVRHSCTATSLYLIITIVVDEKLEYCKRIHFLELHMQQERQRPLVQVEHFEVLH